METWYYGHTLGVRHFHVHATPGANGVSRQVAIVFSEKDARIIANAPALLALADRFFSFYELHKSARGGALGREYEELRAKIMGEVDRG